MPANSSVNIRLAAVFTFLVLLGVLLAIGIVAAPSYLIVGLLAISLSIFCFYQPHIAPAIFVSFLIVVGTDLYSGLTVFEIQLNASDGMFLLTFFPSIVTHRKLKGGAKYMLMLIVVLGVALLIGGFENTGKWVRNDFRRLVYVPLLGFWIYNTLKSELDILKVITVVFWATTIAGAKALFVAVFVPPSSDMSVPFQAFNMVNPQFLGQRVILLGADTFFLVGPPIGVVLFRLTRSKWLRGLILGAIVLQVSALILSFTRTNWLTCAFLLVIAAVYSFEARGFGLLKVVLLLAVISLSMNFLTLFSMQEARFSVSELVSRRVSGEASMGGGYGDLTEWRVAESMRALAVISRSPIFGAGLGSTFDTYIGPGVWGETTWTHVGWIWLLLKFGAVGTVVLCYIFAKVLKTLWSFSGDRTNSGNYASFGIAIMLLGILIMSITVNRMAAMEGASAIGLAIGCGEWIEQKRKTKFT